MKRVRVDLMIQIVIMKTRVILFERISKRSYQGWSLILIVSLKMRVYWSLWAKKGIIWNLVYSRQANTWNYTERRRNKREKDSRLSKSDRQRPPLEERTVFASQKSSGNRRRKVVTWKKATITAIWTIFHYNKWRRDWSRWSTVS